MKNSLTFASLLLLCGCGLTEQNPSPDATPTGDSSTGGEESGGTPATGGVVDATGGVGGEGGASLTGGTSTGGVVDATGGVEATGGTNGDTCPELCEPLMTIGLADLNPNAAGYGHAGFIDVLWSGESPSNDCPDEDTVHAHASATVEVTEIVWDDSSAQFWMDRTTGGVENQNAQILVTWELGLTYESHSPLVDAGTPLTIELGGVGQKFFLRDANIVFTRPGCESLPE